MHSDFFVHAGRISCCPSRVEDAFAVDTDERLVRNMTTVSGQGADVAAIVLGEPSLTVPISRSGFACKASGNQH